MGWFKKKSDPITERARALTEQIAQLEAQIRNLSTQQNPAKADSDDELTAREPEEIPEAPPVPAPPARTPGRPAGPQPRLRSTAFPQGHHVPAASPTTPHAAREPVFEQVAGNPFKGRSEKSNNGGKQLDVRKYDLATAWRRFKNHFRGPPTSNPKLVNYLAAGSIQGLRPLRYEKRVARNRFILLLVALIVVLWGIVALVMRH